MFMDVNQFWQMIEQSRRRFDSSRRDGNMDIQCQELRALLLERTPDDVVAFDEEFGRRMAECYRADLWDAALVLGEGLCSDDWFDYFQRWLISMGRGVFERALRDPDSLADVAHAPGIEDVFFEDFGAVARSVYEEQTGEEESPAEWHWPPLGGGRRAGSLDEIARRYPRIWARSKLAEKHPVDTQNAKR
jgi:hypothetical protein